MIVLGGWKVLRTCLPAKELLILSMVSTCGPTVFGFGFMIGMYGIIFSENRNLAGSITAR